MMMNWFARLATTLLFAWLLAWVVFGTTPSGYEWYSELAGNLFTNPKAGLPLLTLTLPILLSGSLVTAIALREPEANKRTALLLWLSRFVPPQQFPSWNRSLRRFSASRGDIDFDQAAIAFILIPSLIYVMAFIYRRLHGTDRDLDYKLMEIGNAFAFAALIAMSVLLIPVARQSSILKLFGWNPADAVKLHIWSGRIIIVGSLTHGAFHSYRWFLAGEKWAAMVFPPGPCWSSSNSEEDFQPECVDQDTDCSCYDHFRNLTGIFAAIGLVAIALSSLHAVRRRFYIIFYRVHVLAGPFVLLMTILHWNRSILFIAGGVLYYIASSFPVMVESRNTCRQDGGTQLVSTRQITSEEGEEVGKRMQRPCVSLTFEASETALSRFRAGQYVKLLVPEISHKSHPFTINIVPGKSNQVRIIFRVMGSFTSSLAARLAAPTFRKMPVTMTLDGYHGPSSRVNQVLQHDVVVMIAGGIGITPYLSLLHRVHACISQDPLSFKSKKIVLHWMCRDAALVEYIRQEYFEPLLELPKESDFRVQIIVHRTTGGVVVGSNSNDIRHAKHYSDSENPQDVQLAEGDTEDRLSSSTTRGVPFSPSKFSPVSKTSYKANMVMLFVPFAVTAYVGLAGVWYFYKNVQEKSDHLLKRVWSPIFVVLLGIVVSVSINALSCNVLQDEDEPASVEWTPVTRSADDDDDDVEGSLELRDMSNSVGDTDDDAVVGVEGGGALSEPQTVTLEECEGRPTDHQLVNSLDDAQLPGMFVCGPLPLMQEIRRTVRERCAVRMRQCISGEPVIALYEESFEM